MLRNLVKMSNQVSPSSSLISVFLPLLASCVPDLQFNLLAVDLNSFDHEVHTDGRSLARREHSLGKPPYKASLAHSGVTNQDNLQTNTVMLCGDMITSQTLNKYL